MDEGDCYFIVFCGALIFGVVGTLFLVDIGGDDMVRSNVLDAMCSKMTGYPSDYVETGVGVTTKIEQVRCVRVEKMSDEEYPLMEDSGYGSLGGWGAVSY